MKKYVLALWLITKQIVLAPLPSALAAIVVSYGVVYLYRLAAGQLPDWVRGSNQIMVTMAEFAALLSFLVRQARIAYEEFEKLLESRNRIRKLQDEL